MTIDELIDQLQANGYKNHSRAAFKQKLYNSPSFRRELYDANGFKSHGIGYKDFESKLNINNGTIAQSNSEYEEDKRTKSIDDGADKDGQGVIDFAQNVVRHVTDGLMSSSSGLSKAIGNTAISLYGGVTGSDMTNTHAEFNKSMDDARDKLQALMGSPINYISDQIDSDDEDAAAAKSVKRYKEEREAQNKRYELEVWDDTKGVGENIVSLPYKVLSQPVEALSIALSTTGDIFLAKSSVGTRFFGMGVDGAYDELKKINAENPDLHLDDHPNIALGYSASVGVIQGLFEKYSVDKILGPAASKRAANYVLNKAVREITKRGGVITTELLEKEVAAVSRRIGTKVGAAALNTLVATGVEGSEELFTEMGNDAIRIMTNHIGSGLGIDGDIFDIDEMKNTAAERYLTNFAAGAVGGAGLGMTHGLFNNSSDYIRYTYATENNKDEARAQIDSEIQNSRKYSDEMKSALLGYSELMHDMSTKIDNDADIDTKKKMMALLGSKSYQISKVQSLEQKIATIDDSLKEAQQPLLDREKAKLAHINNVILATYKGNDLVYNEKDGQYTKTIGDETSTISELEYMIGSVAQLQDKRKDGDATDDEDGSFADDDADLISDLTRGVEAVSDIPVEVIKPLDVGTKIEYNGVRGEVVEIDRLKDGSIRSIKLKDDDGNDTFVFINGKDIEEYGIQIISDENTRQTNDDGSVGEENQSEAQTEDGGISEGESTITAVEGEPSDIGIADDDGSTKEGQKEQEPLYKSDPGYVSELEKEHSRLTKERDEYISDIAELKAIDPTFDENGEETAKAQRIYDDGIKNAEEKARTNSINKRRDADIKKAKDIGKRKGIDVTKTIENINKKYDEELGENQKENEVGHTKVSRVLDSQIDDENFPRENIESHPIFQSNARKAKESKGRAEGKAFKKTLANGEVITGKYILINKNDVFASHRAHSFSKTPGVPVNKNGNTFNDNDYERSKTAQAKQIKDANNYDQRAIEDPVLIDRNGVVKSGNGRTISRQMSNAKSSQKYTNELKERAEEFGFTKEQVEAIGDEDVMLAVELDGDPVYTTKEYAKYNEDSTKKKTPTEDAIVKAKSLDEKTISQMASVFEDSDVMSDLSLSDIDRLRNILINNGVISETNQSLYFDENGKLTASGSELIENILLASIFNENEIRTLSKLPSIRKKLAQNRVRLLNNRRKEETSVINLVRRAISIIGLSTSYSGSFEDKLEQYITQSDMFDVVDSDKDVVLMAILINDASKFRQLLDSLNNIVEGEDLFGNTIDSASVLSSVYDMVHDELSDKQKLVLEKAGYNINIEEYEKQEEGNETVSDKGKDGLTSGRQEGNIGTVSDGKNKSETGGKENDRKKEGVDEVDRGKDISYESDTSSKKKDSTEDVVNKDVKEAEEVGKDEKDKKTEASDSTDFEATDKKLADKIKKIDDEIDDIWADFNKLGISLTPEQQAENMAKAVRLMSLYAQKGVYKLAQIINDAIKHFGRAKTEEFLPFLKKAYLASQSEVEDDIIDKFDDVKSVRNFKILDDVSGIDTNRENNNVKIQEDESKEVNNKGHGASGSFMDRTREIVEQGSLFGDDEVGGIIRSGEGKRGEVSQGRGGDERSVPSGRSRGDSKEGTLSGTVRLTNNVPIPGTIEPQQSPKKNYEPKSIDAPRTFNIKSHFEDNNTAIRTLLSIIKDGDRLATEAEKEILAKYVGWGGIKAVNRIEGQAWSNADMPYKELFGELVELTKDFEAIGYSRLLNDISKSTLNAHYTGTDVIEGIYSALEHLGFKGGNILEPSAGIGNFIGFAPKNIMNNSSVTAIEIDRLTGKILEKLYPSASTFIKGYEEVSMPLNGFDLIVSNIPFGNYGVATSRNDSPIVKKASKKIHNYFFAKALEQVKDGGIIAFVTSTGVMDSKGNEFLRQYISENAWFIGAIRLPNKTFKGLAGTSVTTDIIFLKKTASPISNTDFIGTSDVEINGEVLSINNYFKENPNHVIGEYTIGRLYGGKQIAVEYKGENSIYDEISSIVKKGFPKNIVSATQSIPQSHAHATVTNIEPNTIIYDKEGSYFITDAGIKRKIANKHQAKVPSFIRLRDILKEQYRLEASPNVKDEEIEANRALLNKEYDNYVSNFGALNTQDNKPFVMSDVFGYNLLGSELKDKDSNRYHKADIFKKRVINKNNRVDIADNLGDAISISINETGAIDIKRLASLLNVKEETLVEDYYGELFYDSDGTVVDREAYLSGNVKKKYKEAVSLSESNPIYNKNVEALEKVIPKDIPIELIDINIGARFVPIEYYRDFATFIFNTQVEASYNRILDQYKFKGGNSANVNLLYGTSRIDGYKLLEHALHGSRPTIYDKIDESTTIVNQEETQLAIEKLEEIERVFRNWIVSDGNRASVLKRIYNDAFNTTIKREFSPKGFSINGSNSAITLADHQVSAIKMLVTNRGGIIDHIVGAGKTFLMISAAMKMKQLGIANKPTIIGLKSTIQDLVSDAKKLFPTASILSPSENDFSAQNRKSFLAKIQNNDWDIIIMSHEQFGYIPQDNEFQQNIIQQEIEEIEQALLQSAGDTGPSKQQLSGLIKRKENLTKKLSELSSRDIDKEVINFRNIGIDHLFVDESQYFKNLQYTTRINRVSGLGNPIGSKRSYNMLTAIRTLQAKNGGDKGVTFLSGTPISNSLVEMYLLLKYLRPTKLEELGYRTFDSWVKQFATQSSQMEFTVSGSVKLKNRFREFVNIPELSILYNEIADIRNDNNLKLPKPVIRGGSPQLIAVKQSDEQLEWTDRLIEFSNQKHGDRDGSLIGKPNMSESQQSAAMLLVTNISNKLSVDLRLVDKNSPFNPDGKLAAAANVIKEEYDKSSGIKGTQLIFSDIGTPKSGRVMDDLQSFLEDQLNVSNDDINLIFGEANDEGKRPSRSISKIKENIKEILEYTDSQIDQIIQDSKGSKDDFNAYSELRRLLIQHGIPESEIAFIHDYKTKKQREKLFKAVNEGSIRVVIGSTQKLGTGVNIQQRIVALHHIDAKWNPADMEQRNGRGIRQKNMNKEVAVYNYGTERTLDAYKYQLISTKQKFINQVKSGALSEDRYALEEDGEDLAASSITAILSGNPLLFEKAKTDSEVEKLRRSQRAFIAQQSNIDSEIEALEHSIPNQQKFIEKRVKDIDTTKANTMTNKDGELKPTWVIDGKRVDDNDTRVSLVKAKTDTVRNAEPGTTVLIGKVGGLQYIAQKVHNENAGLFTSDIQYKLVGEMEYKSNTLPFNAIEKLPADLEKAKTFLEKSKKDLESLKEKENRVWDKQNELDQKIIKQKQINDSLANQNEESSLSQDKKNVSRGEVGLGFKEILQRTPLSNDSKKVLQFILKKFPYIANNVDFIEDQKVWDDLVGSDEYGGWYATDDETGRIVILLNPKKKAGRDETILHEVIHAFTQTIIDNPRTAAEREYVAQITELYNKFKSIKGVSQTHAYIYDDIHEFVTYTMTNTPFQRFLRNRLSTRSLFDKVIDAIRNMFGFPSNDIVNKVISSTKAIISTTDYSNIQERILDGYRAQKGAKIDISTQGSNKTNKVYETKVETKSGKGETVQFKSSQGTNDYTSSDNIQREGDKVKSSGIGRTIAGVWNKFKNIQFTGTTKVKNAADVAHIMRLLEDKSVEHAFAVHIDSKGNSHIQFLSIGGVSGTVVDPKLVLSGVAKFKSKKVYLVHNHPSGNMTPSNADRDITKKITEGLSSLTTEFEHIIMDTYKQEYLVLDKYGYTDGRFTREKREEGRKLSTHIFDGAKVLTEPLAKITSSSDVAEFLYQKRFSVLPKNGYLILNQQNNIIGNFSFKGDVNVNELLLSFGETATAKSVIMYGNSAPLNLNAISVRLNKLDVGLLDYVEVKGGGNDVKGAYDYISAAGSGLLNEVQAKYGTNMVNEPVNDSSDLRFQILGEKGAAALDKYDEATHRMDNLEVARQMEEAGKTEKEIRRATGWERGVDKLWRYEILDIDLIKRFGDNTKIKSALRILGRGYEIELKQLDRFNDLIKAYPKLNRLKVRLGYLSTAAGSYGGDTITLSEYKYRDVIKDIQFNLNRSGEFGGAYVLNDDYLLGKLNELTSTLLHEIQHAIQEIEGFARGGSPTQFMNWNIERLREDNEKNAEILRDLIKEGEKKGLSPSEVMSIGDGLIASNNLSKLQNAIYEYENAPELYRSLAGEVETRNVGQRIGMTPEQRRETLLTETEDVAREDQIVMMDGVEQAMSLSDSESQPITEAESKTLTDWLNKAFGGAVKIFSDWEDFEKIAKERGVSDGDIDNVRLSIKKIGRTGKQIDFGSTNVSGVSKGLRNFFVRNLFDYDFNIARTGSQYFSFNNGLVDGNIRVSNHTKADDNIRIGSRNSYDVEVYEDGTVHFDIDTIHNNLTSKDISKSLKAVQDIMSKVIADSDALIKDIKTIFNTDKSISEKKQDAFSYLSSKIDTSRIDSNLIDVFIPELAMSLNKAEQGVDFAKERYNEVIKKQEDKKERLIAALERTRVNNEREKKAKEAYNRFKKGEITAEEYSKEHSRIYNNSDIKLLQYPDGTVYGAVLPDGSMYLNPERLNANTPIHEHTHLFNQVIQKTNPKLWDKIVEATKKTELWEEVKNDPNYANLKTDSQIADEVFSRFVGDKGEGSWQERIAKADSKSRLAKVGELIKEYWNAIKEFFGVDIYKGMTADDFANMTLDKLFSGKEIKGAEEAIGVKDDKSVVKKMMIGGKEVEVKTLPQVTNGFYSPIEKKLLDEKATNLSATKWLERLGKGDEMQFTGLKDFLESKKPNEQVKKSDIQDFMRDNRIEVVEVVKLDRPFREIKKAFENVGNEWEEVYGGVYAKLSDKSNEYERRYNLKINGVEYGRDFTYLDAKSYVEANAQTNPEKNRSKFSQYQLEGQKENYKEIMIVLPREGSMKKVGDYTVPSAHKYGEDLADNRRVVHLRMNTRTDADGNKVLFLEEVQSDHNQEARKKGVRNEKEMKRISELADLFLEDRTKNQEGTPERIEYEKLTARNNTQGVPDAPFIKDTNATTKLGLKVALKEAVAQGADKISWTTGEQQNERYDLSKQVDWINAEKTQKGDYKIEVGHKDNRPMETQYLKENELEPNLGKELATKIINDGGGMYKGLDLKVGGKGMKGFYGEPSEGKLGIVGQVAKSLFKQEPKTVEIETEKYKDADLRIDEQKDGTFSIIENPNSSNKKIIASGLKNMNEVKSFINTTTQHAITITPEMRQQVQEGLPLFNVGLDVARFMVKSQLKSDKVMFNISDKYWNDLGKVVNDAKNVEDLNNALDIISDAIFQKYSKKRAVISNNRVRAQVRMLQSTNPREMATVISNAGVMFKTDADDYSEGDLEKLKKPAEDMLTKSRIDIGQKWNEVLKNYPSSVRYLVYRGIYKFISKESEAYPIGYIKEAFDSTIQRFSESDSPQNFDFYTEYNQSIIDLLGEDRDSVINVDTDNGISGTWIKMNKASDSNDIEATKIKVAAASNGTSWCTKQTDTSGTGAKKVIEEDNHDFYVFFPKNTTQATIAIVPIREGEEEQLVNNSWYTGVFKQSNASDNNVDPEYYETVNQLAKKTKDKDLAYTLEKIGYSGLSKEEIKELQRQKDKVKLDWFENHSGEIFTDEDIEDINRIYGISIIVNGDQLGLHEWTEGIEEQLPESIRKDFGNKLFKSISYIELDANFKDSQVQSLGNLQSIGGYAYFEDSQVQSLGNLQSIGGNAYFNGSPITSLGNLQSIGGNAYFEDSQVQSLGNLQSIGGYANFNDSQVQSLGNLQSIGGDADFMDSKKNIFRLLKTGDNVAKEKALRIKDIFTNAHYSYLANLKNGGDIKLFNDFLPAEFRLRREEIDVNLSHNSDEIRFSMSESAVNQADKAATVGNTDPIGKVVINLNKSGATKEAQIKEFASAWITVMQRQSASFINRGLELVADTEYIKETRGDAMLALQNAIADHTSKLKKTDKLIGWVKSFWVRVGKMLRINISSDRLKEMTIGEFLDIASAQLRYTNDIISELLADSTSDNKAIETEGKKSEENYREESISEREKKLLDEYESLIANMDNEGGKSDTRQNNMSIEEEYDFIGRDLSDNTQALVRTNGKEYDSMLQSLVGSAKKVVETIAFLMPTLKNAGISVTLHKSTSSYYNAVANNGGSAIEATRSFAFYKDGQIHINIHKPGIKANVAIHEALHPIIRDLLVNNKPVFDRFVNDILNDKELRKKYYDDFAMARYSHLDGDKISEEAIIEASADIILARIIKGLDAASDSVFNRVLKYIKEALGKTYGKLFEHVNTRADFNAFANTLADGISKGMVISFNREGKAAIKEIVENAASIADGNNTKNITGEKVDNDDAINNKKQASGLSQSIQDNRAQQKRAIQSKLTADILTNPDINWEHIASKLVTSGVLTKDEVDDILNGWRQKNASVNTVGKNMSSDQTLMAIEGMAELLHLRNMTEDDDVRITHEAMDELVANLDGELSDSLLHYTPYEVKATIKRIADSGLAHPVNILQIFHNVINSGNVPGHEKFIAMGIAISQLKSSLKKYKDIYKKTGDKHSADMVDSINDMLLRLAAASKTASSLSGAALGIHSKLIELGGLTYEGQLIELDGINKRGKNIEIEESDKKQINALVNKINELQAALDKAITSNETKNDGDKEKETTYRTIRKVNAGKQPILSKEVLLAKLRKLRASSTSFSLAMSVSDHSDMSYNEIIVELIKVAHIDGAVTFKDVVEAVKGYDNQITENDIYNAVISQTHESKAKRLSELAQREATTKRHARDIARLEKMIKDDIAALLVNNKVPDTNRMHSIRKLLYDIEKNIYSIDTTGSIMATQQNAIDQIRDNYDIAFLHPSPDKSTEDMLSSIVNAIRMLHDAKYKAWIEETYRNLKKEIDNINEAIKNGTFAKTVSPSNDTRKEIPTHISVPVFDDDGEVIGIDEQEFNYGRILRDISTMRREIEAIKNKYRNSESAYHKWYVRFRNTIGGSMAMMDLSYFAVQGYRALTLFWRNPKMFIQAFSKSISVMADEFSRNPGKADIIYKQIVENPYYQRAVSLGLVISDPEAHIHIKEEIGGDDYFDIIYDKTKNKKGLLASTINVPLKIRKKVKTASNASFATHLNLISINTVSAYIERVVSKTGEQPSDKELEAIIRDVNNSTGRPHFKQGSHGGKIAVGASYVLWAPKLYASQIFNIANIALDPIKLAYYASRGEKDMTRAYMYKAANSVLAFATTTAVIYGLRAMLAKIQCGDNVGYNTEKGTSRSNWMKIQCGDWSFDPTGNHRQWIRLGYNLIKTVQNEPPVDYRGEKISPSQQIFNVLRYKSNPALAFVSSLFTGTDFMNRGYYADDTSPMQIKSRGGVIKDAFIPIFGNNLVDLYKFAMSDNSERLRLKPLVAVEQVLGFGVTYIDPKEKEERKEIEKKEKADSKKEKSEDALQKLIKEGLPKEYSEGEFQDNVDWSNISLTDKQYKSKDGKRRQVFRHISDTNHDGKENDCFVWRTRIRGKRKGEKYKERVPCE